MAAVANPPAAIPTGPSHASRPSSSSSAKPDSRKQSAEPKPTLNVVEPSAEDKTVKKEDSGNVAPLAVGWIYKGSWLSSILRVAQSRWSCAPASVLLLLFSLFSRSMTSTFSPALMALALHPTQGFKLTPCSPCTPPPSHLPPQPPIILHDGFLSPAPAFPIDALSTHLAPTSRAPSPVALPFHTVFDFDDDEAGKSPKGQPAPGDNPVRPPARPHSAVRSKFDLEPNPFDVSFSKSSYHSNSDMSDRNTPPRGTDATSIKHNALPPLSSLTSPAAADPSQFPWLAAQSLRTGPLSPAMLAGPAQANGQAAAPRAAEGQPSEGTFDQNTFRTGFTPGASTGFTPNYSSLMAGNFASSLPMPSPNTAAFLNMVTNSTPMEGSAGENGHAPAPPADGQAPHPPSAIPPHMQQHHGLSHLQPQQHGGEMGQDTITPGTLSALTGVFNDMNRGAPPHGPHPPQFFQPGMPHPPPGMPPHAHPHQGPPHADYAQQSANAASQAANGLFLLSQAHQELSKREEEGRGTTPLMGKRAVSSNLPPNARPQPPPSAVSATGTKRKSDAGAPKAKKGKKNTPEQKFESASPNFDSDDDMGDDKTSNNGKPETEEDKRKNFLERNRQAALKCRQRKKAWLGELQQKVEQLTVENERLQQTIGGLHDEVGRLSSILMQHRDCGLGMPAAGYGRPLR